MSRSLSLPFSSLSPVDALRAQEALWPLLRQQARLYAPESTSLPEETAAALAESILLTLGADGRLPSCSQVTFRSASGRDSGGWPRKRRCPAASG